MWNSFQILSIFLFVLAMGPWMISGRRGRSSYKVPSIPPDTVKSINVTAYLGRWYQMYASVIPNTTFERNGYCVCADYFTMQNVCEGAENVAFGLTNSMRVASPTGDLKQANGTVFNTSDPGKYEVQFEEAPNEKGNYWIVALGDIPADESSYPWSIVSTPFKTSLYILARDVERFRSVYAKEVFSIVHKEGFTSNYNKPLETYQGGDCLYPELAQPISNYSPSDQCLK